MLLIQENIILKRILLLNLHPFDCVHSKYLPWSRIILSINFPADIHVKYSVKKTENITLHKL